MYFPFRKHPGIWGRHYAPNKKGDYAANKEEDYAPIKEEDYVPDKDRDYAPGSLVCKRPVKIGMGNEVWLELQKKLFSSANLNMVQLSVTHPQIQSFIHWKPLNATL